MTFRYEIAARPDHRKKLNFGHNRKFGPHFYVHSQTNWTEIWASRSPSTALSVTGTCLWMRVGRMPFLSENVQPGWVSACKPCFLSLFIFFWASQKFRTQENRSREPQMSQNKHRIASYNVVLTFLSDFDTVYSVLKAQSIAFRKANLITDKAIYSTVPAHKQRMVSLRSSSSSPDQGANWGRIQPLWIHVHCFQMPNVRPHNLIRWDQSTKIGVEE